MIVLAFNAAWHTNEASEVMLGCVKAGFRRWFDKDPNGSKKLGAEKLGVDESRITAMLKGLDPGPGFLRFANLPADFWIGFIAEWGLRFCIRVITDHELDRMVTWINFHMVRTMKRDAARMYPGEDFEDVPEEEERKRA